MSSSQTHTCAHTPHHTCARAHTHTHTYTCAHRHTHTHNVSTHSLAHTDIMHTLHTCKHMCACAPTCTHMRAHIHIHIHTHTHMHKHTCAFTRTCHTHMKVTDRTWRGHAEVGRRMEESHVPLSPSHHVLETGSWSLPQRLGGSQVHKTSPLTGKQTFHLYTGQQPTIHVIISLTSAVSTGSVNIHFTCADRQHFQSKQPAVGLQHIHYNCLPTDNKKGPKINIMIASTGCPHFHFH